MMYAVIKTGGKQYLIKKGDEIKVEKLGKKVGEKIEFEPLLIFDEKGEKVEIGKPKVANAKVQGEILEEGRSKKVSVIKYKRKIRYKRNIGHRQWYTKIKILDV